MDNTQFDPGDTKVCINNLLFQVLPEDTTIGDMENISCKVFDLVEQEWTAVLSKVKPTEEGV